MAEELRTVNDELKGKVDETARAKGDLENLIVSTEIATLFLDRELRIQRFTPHVRDLFHILSSDVGRPLGDLAQRFGGARLVGDAEAVMERLEVTEREIETEDGRGYLVHARPYRTVEDRIDGVVVTFVDITRRRADEAALRESEARYRTLFESIDEGFCVIEMIEDEAGALVSYRFIETNPAFQKHSGLADVNGRTIHEVVPGVEGHWIETYGHVATTGESTRFIEESLALGQWFEVEAFRVGAPEPPPRRHPVHRHDAARPGRARDPPPQRHARGARRRADRAGAPARRALGPWRSTRSAAASRSCSTTTSSSNSPASPSRSASCGKRRRRTTRARSRPGPTRSSRAPPRSRARWPRS